MKINELKQKIKQFEKKTGFDKTKYPELVKMLQKEAKNPNSNHKLTDILMLVMQMANRRKINFDKEIKKWFKKSKKYER